MRLTAMNVTMLAAVTVGVMFLVNQFGSTVPGLRQLIRGTAVSPVNNGGTIAV